MKIEIQMRFFCVKPSHVVNKGEINMQKLVVDAPDKLEKGESFGPGGVRINGKMKIQYRNPETLEN